MDTIKTSVKEWLKDNEIFHFPYAAGTFSMRGIPDTIIQLNGVTIYVEFKKEKGYFGATDDGEPSKIQIEKINKLNEEGGCALVLYPSDVVKFENYIIKIKSFMRSGYESYYAEENLKRLGIEKWQNLK